MAERRNDMKLSSVDDLFTTQKQREDSTEDKVIELYLDQLVENPNNPFKVSLDDRMEELIDSVKEHGVIVPIIVRPRNDGKYEIVSGHRRKFASLKAGRIKIDCIVKNLTDDEATILMVDSNIQREEILPSEKAFAYKMKLEAMNHQGKNIDDFNEVLGINSKESTSTPMVSKLRTNEKLGNEVGESRENIRRYIRLTKLIPELLEEVDNKRIAFRPAVELSYLSDENQYIVLNKLEFDEVSPSLSQAIFLKKMQQEGTITEEKIEELLDKEKPNQKEFIKIHNEKIDRYIPTKIKETGNVEDFIILCVQEHNKRERLKQERDAR